MTVATLHDRTLGRLDDATGAYYNASLVLEKLNEAERLFAFLTLCLEKTAALTVTANTPFFVLSGTFTDFLLPLRVKVQGGARLEPARLSELDAENEAWQKTTGTPTRYSMLGFYLFAINKQPSSGGTSLDVTYAQQATTLSNGTQSPAIPAEYHPVLIDYAVTALLAKAGGRAFLDSLDGLERYLAAATKCAAYVRARSLAQRYDRQPFEMRSFDRSRLIETIRGASKPARKAKAIVTAAEVAA